MFASIGSFDDQANPDIGHGWLSRLVDSSASAAAGFSRVRKAQLLVSDEAGGGSHAPPLPPPPTASSRCGCARQATV